MQDPHQAGPESTRQRSNGRTGRDGRHVMRKSTLAVAAAAIAGGLMAVPAAAELDQMNLKVVGTWGNLSNWKVNEGPFWQQTVPEASGGRITADAVPQTEVGIKGFEVMRMLKLGVFDVAHGVVGYIYGEDPIVEGVDLSGVIQNWADARASLEAYRPIEIGRASCRERVCQYG